MRTNKKHPARLMSLLLALVMVLGLFPGTASAAGNHAPEYQFGKAEAQTALIPGIYELPVEMKKEDKHAQDSMAAGCIKGGALEVMNSGDAYVNIKLGSHTMMGLTAYAFDWKIFDEYNVTSALTAAEIVSRDSEGNVTEIRFQLPYTDGDGVYAQMHVQAGPIDMTPNAFLLMRFEKAAHNHAAEAARIDNMIAALGQEITQDSEAAVMEARNSYEWLVPESKAQVRNLDILEEAEAKLSELKDTKEVHVTYYMGMSKVVGKADIRVSKSAKVLTAEDCAATMPEGYRFVKAAKLHTDRKTGELTARVKVEKVPVVSERKITVLYTAARKGQVGMAQLTVNSDVSRLSAADCAETMPKGYEFVKSGKITKIGIVRITVRPIGR